MRLRLQIMVEIVIIMRHLPGHIDLVMEDSLAAHDIMAVAALMQAAGQRDRSC